ncbi:hypothetical protein [Curtobacterium sp. MCPF17_021]|uniref:hypothetical protein n=1 Tax=Curtobacterium sp. MCPF17_021 TaxID=2175639 RepID=UPI0011B7B8D6|nr:hypothetical protein [Curtobacterium sp. MCPF17_021]WIE85098.1 hypothetical protein DEJ29_018240 [Curtobacterium sp. MCPF17_021]
MSVETRPPRTVVTGVASGLVLMAVFSLWWASDTYTGWPTAAATVVMVVSAAAAAVFLVQAVRLFVAGRRLSTVLSASDQARKPNSALFGAVFGAEGVLIGTAVGVLGANGLDRFIVPTIAVIVGLHFYPMARVFRRSIDNWIATWTTLVGVAGVIAIIVDAAGWSLAWSWVGLGAALATLSYGIYMTSFGQQLLARAAAGSEAVAPTAHPTTQG